MKTFLKKELALEKCSNNNIKHNRSDFECMLAFLTS